jgi:hypothetical protein
MGARVRKMLHVRVPCACKRPHTCRLEFMIQTCTGDVCTERVEAFGGNGGGPFSCPVPHGHEVVALAGALGGVRFAGLNSISFYSMAQPEVRAPASIYKAQRHMDLEMQGEVATHMCSS